MRFTSRPLALFGLVFALACGSETTAPPAPDVPPAPDPTVPTLAAVEGIYTATRFVTTIDDGDGEGTETTDQLAAGATLSIALLPDGTTFGFLDVEAAPPTSLVGTWRRDGDTITFTHSVDTFVQRLQFSVAPGELIATGGVGFTFDVVLTRQLAFDQSSADDEVP